MVYQGPPFKGPYQGTMQLPLEKSPDAATCRSSRQRQPMPGSLQRISLAPDPQHVAGPMFFAGFRV